MNFYNQNPLARCEVFTISGTSCGCILTLTNSHGHSVTIPLQDAFTTDFTGGFLIQSPMIGVKVSSASGFTSADIDLLICNCLAG